MKKAFEISLITAVLILIGLNPASVLAGSTPKGKPFVEVQGQFIEVEGQIQSIEDQVETLVGKVASFEDRITANKNAITALKAENASILSNIQELIDNSAASSEDIAAALLQIQELQSKIASLDPLLADEIASLKDQIGTLQDFVSTNSTGVQTLQSQLQNNYQLINALQVQIDNFNEALAFKQDVLSGNCPAGTVLKHFDGEGNIQCEAISATAGVTVTTMTQLFTIPASYTVITYETCNCHTCGCGPFGGCSTCCDTCPSSHYYKGKGGGIVTCPEGEFLTSGGYINDFTDFVTVTASSSTGTSAYPGQSWGVGAENTSDTPYDIYVTANCVSFQP